MSNKVAFAAGAFWKWYFYFWLALLVLACWWLTMERLIYPMLDGRVKEFLMWFFWWV